MPDLDQLQARVEELQSILQELIETAHDGAKEMERFVTWVEQQTSLRDTPKELRVVVAKLADLHHRARKLTGKQAGS